MAAIPKWTHCRICHCGVSSPKPRMNSSSRVTQTYREVWKSWLKAEEHNIRNVLFILLVQWRNPTHITEIKVKTILKWKQSLSCFLCLSGHSSTDSTSPSLNSVHSASTKKKKKKKDRATILFCPLILLPQTLISYHHPTLILVKLCLCVHIHCLQNQMRETKKRNDNSVQGLYSVFHLL